MNWLAWATFAFSVISAAGVIASNYFGFARHIAERKQASHSESQRWSLDVSAPEAPEARGWLLARLTYRIGGGPQVHLKSISLVEPRGVLLAPRGLSEPRAVRRTAIQQLSIPDLSGAGKRLAIGKDMEPATRINLHPPSIEAEDYSLAFFFFSLPKPSRRSAERRLTIMVDAEETSSARRPIRLKVKTRPIDVNASNADVAS